MPNLRIISTNDADAAVLTSSAFLASLPVENLQVEGRARVARTVNATGDKVINGNWSVAKIASAIVLYGCNFSSAATLRVQLWDGENQTGSVVHDSGVNPALDAIGWGEFGWGLSSWGATAFEDWASAFSVLWFPQVYSARSFRITINDASNAAGFIQIKRLLIGAYFEPFVNFEYGLSATWVDNSVQTRTMGRSINTDKRAQFRSLSGNLSGLNASERAAFFEITRVVGLSTELFVSGYPEAGGAMERDHALLCKFDQIPPVIATSYNRYSGQFSFVEV